MSTPGQKPVGVQGEADISATFGRHVSSGKVRFFQAAGIDFVMGRREGPYIGAPVQAGAPIVRREASARTGT